MQKVLYGGKIKFMFSIVNKLQSNLIFVPRRERERERERERNTILIFHSLQAIWSRCFPVYRKIKEEVRSGNLGEIQHVQCQFCVPISNVDRITKPELGGGALHDLGIYVIQMATLLFNNEKPVRITADASLTDQGL